MSAVEIQNLFKTGHEKEREQHGRLKFISSSFFYNFLCFCALLMEVMIGAFKNFPAVSNVAQWIECWLVHRRVAGSIPVQGHMPVQSGHM